VSYLFLIKLGEELTYIDSFPKDFAFVCTRRLSEKAEEIFASALEA
jgi:alkyl hydroperoxide reductase subunit AhpC